MSILLIAEIAQGQIAPATLSAISAAAELKQALHVLVAGVNCQAIAQELATIKSVQEVLVADHAVYEHPTAERFTELVLNCKASHTYFIAAATSFGKDLMPRIAAKLDTPQISDVIRIIDAQTFKRPIYAGNALITVKNTAPIQVLTIRQTAFKRAASNSQTAAAITSINFVSENNQARFVKKEQTVTDRPQLTSSDVVISGGRGLDNAENFQRLMTIAKRMGAAFGASRAAVDAGLAPNDCQVGQTGQVVAPKLYIAVGISGAIQHLAGMKDSSIIVAINRDPEAPIFQVADYGLIGNIEDILPAWEAELTKLGY